MPMSTCLRDMNAFYPDSLAPIGYAIMSSKVRSPKFKNALSILQELLAVPQWRVARMLKDTGQWFHIR